MQCCSSVVQVDFVLRLLQRYRNLELVIVSDVDTVWLRDPRDYLATHPAADWFASTDCLSHTVRGELGNWERGRQASPPTRSWSCFGARCRLRRSGPSTPR